MNVTAKELHPYMPVGWTVGTGYPADFLADRYEVIWDIISYEPGKLVLKSRMTKEEQTLPVNMDGPKTVYPYASWADLIGKKTEEWKEKMDTALQNSWNPMAIRADIAADWKDVIDRIMAEAETYTEWEEVGEDYQDGWIGQLVADLMPLVKSWLDALLQKDPDAYKDYVQYFFN